MLLVACFQPNKYMKILLEYYGETVYTIIMSTIVIALLTFFMIGISKIDAVAMDSTIGYSVEAETTTVPLS